MLAKLEPGKMYEFDFDTDGIVLLKKCTIGRYSRTQTQHEPYYSNNNINVYCFLYRKP